MHLVAAAQFLRAHEQCLEVASDAVARRRLCHVMQQRRWKEQQPPSQRAPLLTACLGFRV